MASTTLNTRNTGDTILATFFNDVQSCLGGDFMGRNATGIPTLGQNLGTLAVPWGSLYCTSINLNGSALDTSKIVSPPNRIISGKVRATSNQPAFITPNGAAASCIIAGATTNLVLAIGGATVSVTTDITKTGLTTAPGSANTASVNDATAAAQAETRRWGEYWSSKITISSAGANITALVGKYATFKIVHSAVTEYFTAYVESSTILSHCQRGFFYDSSLNPVNAVLISNSDVITLMKQGFVFMTNDGATVDVTYNSPTWASSSPTSPVTGDYWYDSVNSIWKRYDGAAWQIINRTLIGMVVMDATNCVAARSFDFYAPYSQNCTLDLEISSTATIAIAKRPFMGANVKGNEITFGTTLPTWVGANNYCTSVDYYTTFAISTTYYLYLKDDGTTIISDIAPYFRPDLYGHYHKHNPWRCIAIAATDGSSNWSWITPVQTVSSDRPRSFIRLQAANGIGGTNTAIRRWTNILNNQGNAMTYADSAANGMSVTINEDGEYAISYSDCTSVLAAFGISKNSTQLTTSINSITAADRLACSFSHAANETCSTSWQGPLLRGDVIRTHCGAGNSNNGDGITNHFSISKCSD